MLVKKRLGRRSFLGSIIASMAAGTAGLAHGQASQHSSGPSLPRWKNKPPGSTWGEFGADDQLGRINLLTPAKVRQGAAEIRAGRSFCLSLPLDYPGENVANPDRLPPRLFAVVGKDGQPIFNRVYRDAAGQPTGVVSDDAALLYTQYSTQWDGFPHFGAVYDADGTGEKVTYYNGWNASSMVPPANRSGTEPWARYEGSHADALGIETMAATGVQGRGVLVDLHAHFGRTPHPVTCADLLGIMEKDRVQVERGDILCLYTGFDRVLLEMGKHPDRDRMFNSCAALDGTDPQLLQWLTDSGVAALASDNRAIEMLPIKPPRKSQVFAPLHEHCLFKIGVHLGEMWYLAELADWLRGHHRNRFFLTAPPLRLTGAVGSPVTPVATV